MKQHGKTINKTARYTYEDVRRVSKASIEKSVQRAAQRVHEIHELAFKNYIAEHCPRINITRAMLDYNELIVKFTEDLNNGEFTEAEMRRYNRDPDNA